MFQLQLALLRETSILGRADSSVALRSLLANFILQLLLSLIVSFHVLSTLVALSLEVLLSNLGLVLELANLMRKFHFLLVIVLYFFLGRCQVVGDQLVLNGPRLDELREVTLLVHLVTKRVKFSLMLWHAELTNELLSADSEVAADLPDFLHHGIVLILVGSLRALVLGYERRVALLE